MSFIFQAIRRWWNSSPSTNGAAIAFYTIFSLAPISIILVVIFGRFFGPQVVQSKLIHAIQGVMGQDIAGFSKILLEYAYKPFESFVAASASAIAVIVGSLALFSQAQRSLEDIWHDHDPKTVRKSFFKSKLIAVGMVFILGILLVLSFVSNATTTFILRELDQSFVYSAQMIELLNALFSFCYIFILFVVMYKYMPHKHVSWEAALFGGLVGSFMFVIGRFLLSLYITLYLASTIYGAAGAVILILIWFYYSAQIFFFGGAVAWTIDQRRTIRQNS